MSPYESPPEDDLDAGTYEARQELAQVGGLLMFELISNTRGMVEKPLTIQFLNGGIKVEAYKLGEDEPKKSGDGGASPAPAVSITTHVHLPADRTGIPEAPDAKPAG